MLQWLQTASDAALNDPLALFVGILIGGIVGYLAGYSSGRYAM